MRKSVLIVLVVVVLFVALIGIGMAVGGSSPSTPPPPSNQNSLPPPPATTAAITSSSSQLITSSSQALSGPTSATITVTCNNCVNGQTQSSQFMGGIDNNFASVSYDGNGTQSWTATNNGQYSDWIFSFQFQKNTQDGTLTVTVKLNTGQTVFDNSTTAQYGIVSGSWSSGD